MLGRDGSYFVKNHSGSLKLISSTCSNFVIYKTFVMLGGRVVQQTVGIPMGTNYVPLLADFSFIRMNKMITNDHGYVPLVVNTPRSFPHS